MSILTINYNINYDINNDILYLNFGNSVSSYGDEVEEGLIIRKNILNDEITGVTILDYKKRKKDRNFIKFLEDLNIDINSINI